MDLYSKSDLVKAKIGTARSQFIFYPNLSHLSLVLCLAFSPLMSGQLYWLLHSSFPLEFKSTKTTSTLAQVANIFPSYTQFFSLRQDVNPLYLLKHNVQGDINTVIWVSKIRWNTLLSVLHNSGKAYSYDSKLICSIIFIKQWEGKTNIY